jgi:hypothetical protein
LARKVQIEIVGDTRGLEKAFGRASKEGNKLSRGLKAVGKASAVAIGAGVGAGLVGVAFAARASIKEFADAQKVTAQTNAVLKSTGGIANVTAKHVEALGSSLLKKTGIDDEAIKSGENMILTFKNIRNEAGKGNNIFDQATRAVTDMDVAMTHGASTQESLSKTAIRVGKALNDPIKGVTALGRVGVQFTEAQKKQIKALVDSGHAMEAQKLILRELTLEFGGSAAAAGNTLPGKLNILRETLKNLGAEMVTRLLPTLNKFSSWMIGVGLPAVEKFARGIDFKAVFAAIKPAIESAREALAGFVHGIEAVRNTLGPDIFSGLLIGILGAAGALHAIEELHHAMTALGALGLSGGPVALAFTGLAIIIGGLAASFLHNRRVADELAGAYDRVRNAARSLHDAEVALKQANLDVQQAQLEQTHALDNVSSSQRAYNNAVRDYGAHSHEAIEALHNLQQAKHDQRQADLDLVTATDRARKANREAADTVRHTTTDILDAAAKQRSAGHSMVLNALTFGRSWSSAGENASDFADKIRAAARANEKAQPAIAAAQRAVAALADAMHRIPSDTVIRFIVRTVQYTGKQEGAFARGASGGHAAGGRIAGAPVAADSVPAMLSPGEFVVTGGGERMLESMTFPGVLNWLQGKQPRHFAGGGRASNATKTIEYDRLYKAPMGPVGGGGAVSTHGLVPQVVRALGFARGHGWHGSVLSGFRSYAEQAALYARYLAGGNIAARPGTSSHERGQAVDVSDASTFDVLMNRAPSGSQLFNLVPGDFPHFSVSGYQGGGRVVAPGGGGRRPGQPGLPPSPLAALRRRIAVLRREERALKGQIAAVDKKLAALHKQLRGMPNKTKAHKNRRKALQKQIDQVQAQSNKLHRRLKVVQAELQSLGQRVQEVLQHDYSQLPAQIEYEMAQAALTETTKDDLQALLHAQTFLQQQLTRKGLTTPQKTQILQALAGVRGQIKDLTAAPDTGGGGAGGGAGGTEDLQAQLDQSRAREAVSAESARLANAFVATGVFATNTPGVSGSGGNAPTIIFNHLVPDAQQIVRATEAIASGAGTQGYRTTSVERTGY